LNKGKPILYIKWHESVEQAPHAQMGSPSLFRKANGDYGLVAAENNKGTHIYLWDSEDLLTFHNERRVHISSNGQSVENPLIIYDVELDHYKLFWKTNNGLASYVSLSVNNLDAFGPAVQLKYPDRCIGDTLPDNAVAEEASEFPVSKAEYDSFICKYAPVVNVCIETPENITIRSGEQLPYLPDRVKLHYSDGSIKKLGVRWNEDTLHSIDLKKPGVHKISGTVLQSVFPFPFIPERADPFITYNEDDGYYYATGSYYPQSDPATWSEATMGEFDYDRVTLRRARTVDELRHAEECNVWVPRGEDGFVPFLWAPEIHKINSKWYILVELVKEQADEAGVAQWC
jgi:hypothetical protein